MFTKELLEEKKALFLNKEDYLNFLIEESIKKRKQELKNYTHRLIVYNDRPNNLIFGFPNENLLKTIYNENFNLVIVGDFTKNEDILIKTLELYLLNKAVFIKGKYEYFSLYSISSPLLKKLISITPVFYYNPLFRFGVTYSSISSSLNEKEFITQKLSPEIIERNNSIKEKIINFMDYFKIKILLRRGHGEYFYEIDKNHKILSFGDKIILVDTEVKIFSRENFL